MATLQSLSGTGSLRLAAEFIAKFLPGKTVYLSNPTWGNHKVLFLVSFAAPLTQYEMGLTLSASARQTVSRTPACDRCKAVVLPSSQGRLSIRRGCPSERGMGVLEYPR